MTDEIATVMRKKKCGNPIWCSKETQERVRARAKASRRSMGNEVAAMLDELAKRGST